MRRSEGSPLDLNNLPEDYGKQIVEESSTTTAASAEPTRLKKKKGGGKDESGKVYECRFCSLKFCKSQALGGHMNRHRQERETETLNRARQLVYSNEGLSAGGVMRDVNGVQPGGGSQMSESQWVQFRQLYPRLPAHCQSAPNAHHHHHHHPCNNNNNNNNNNMVQGGSFWASALQPVSGSDNYCVGHVLPAAAISRFEPSYPCFGDIRAANRINQMDIGINNSSWGCTTAFAYDPTSDNIF